MPRCNASFGGRDTLLFVACWHTARLVALQQAESNQRIKEIPAPARRDFHPLNQFLICEWLIRKLCKKVSLNGTESFSISERVAELNELVWRDRRGLGSSALGAF
jgi:hypothetical protein